jgi:BioD-like phosphotransacetylase family protein
MGKIKAVYLTATSRSLCTRPFERDEVQASIKRAIHAGGLPVVLTSGAMLMTADRLAAHPVVITVSV